MPEFNDSFRPGVSGFIHNQPSLGFDKGSLILPSKNVWFPGPGVCESWPGISSTAYVGATTAMLVGSRPGGVNGKGTVMLFRGSAKLWVSNGTVYFDETGTSGAATGGDIYVKVGASAAVPLGLDAPTTAPTVASGAAGKMQGSYSFCYTWKRSSTADESNKSPQSLPISVSSKIITVTVSASPPDPDVDGIALYRTRAGFATTGPHFLVGDYSLAAAAAGISVNQYDGELLPVFAPVDFDPPPPCDFLGVLGGVIHAIGCYGSSGGNGGWGVSTSLQAYPGAFPPDQVYFLPIPEAPTGVIGRPTDGFLYVISRNSLQGILFIASEVTPSIAKALWTNVGFASANAACYVESELYGFTGQMGAVRTSQGAEPDTSFAAKVKTYLATWTAASVVVGYDPANDVVVYAQGTSAIAYHRGLPDDVWSAPLELPASVDSMVTWGGSLFLSCGGTLYQFGSAGSYWSGGRTWRVVPAFNQGGVGALNKTLRRIAVTHNTADSITFNIFGNLSTSAGLLSPAVTLNTSRTRHWIKTNQRRLHSYSFDLTGTAAGQRVDEILVGGIWTEDATG